MTVSKYAKKQTPQEIESAIEVWESQYAPPEFIRDESPEGQHNARMLASVLQSGFFGHFSPSNLSEALQRYRDQFHWRAQQAVPPQPTAEELAAQAETERLAAKARMLERQEEMLRKQNRSGRYNHADPPKQDLSSTADGFRRTVNAQNEARAKVEAEALAIVKMGYFIEGGGPGLPASLFPFAGKPADLTEGGQPVVCWPSYETAKNGKWFRSKRKKAADLYKILMKITLGRPKALA